MKIGIIGAGFTGLSAAHNLLKKGHDVYLFERDKAPGGLAIGFQEKNWDWTLEKHYHHWFTNDKSVLNLAKEINFPVEIKRPKTSVYLTDGNIYQLDSPIALLKFKKLSLFNRLRTAVVLAGLRYNPFWKPLEKINAEKFLKLTLGKESYDLIWEPQLSSKFGQYKNEISLAWFWARVKKRTTKLAYPEGGFLKFANTLLEEIQKDGGNIFMGTEILEIKKGKKIIVKTKGKKYEFDKVIVTLPSFYFNQITPELPESYKSKLMNLKGLGAINLVLRLKKPFFKNGTYWLSVCDRNAPVLAIVEHTNFMDKKHYNNEHLLYLGNYLPANHDYFKMDKKDILKKYDSFIKTLNKEYKENLIGFEAFKVPFAQPIVPVNYSKMIPPFDTPIKNLYLANMQQVYPWDRGTNYAVELGNKISDYIESEN